MRIRSIEAKDILPVQTFNVGGLSDLVVIAGPNGVGKTRLISGLISCLRGNAIGTTRFVLDATDVAERLAWGKDSIDTSIANDVVMLRQLLQQNKRRRNFKSSVLYFESNRTIQNVQPLSFQFEFADPFEEMVSWDTSFNGLANRWQDTQHAIFKKIQSQKTSIANRAIQLRTEGRDSMRLEFTDPLEQFRETFQKLLGPKTLHSADIQAQQLLYKEGNDVRDVSTLSSGEREVLTIAFDFLLRQPSDCVVFFDEPELHLHPELLSRLVTTLRLIGERNQFVFISHSPEIVAASLNDSVVFLTPPKPDGGNQAVLLGDKNDATEALHRLGQSIGVVSLGKKIVLIEGVESSLDRQTYSQLLKNRFPELVLQPSGGKGNLLSFSKIAREVLDRTLWGIKFYMLADRDAAPIKVAAQPGQTPNFQVLSRYHLENYFLDATILSACFQSMEPADSWLRSPIQIEAELRRLATAHLGYATALIVSKWARELVGNVDVMVKGAHQMDGAQLSEALAKSAAEEMLRVQLGLDPSALSQETSHTYTRLAALLSDPSDGWKSEYPGKPILTMFSSRAGMPEGRLKSLYLLAAEASSVNPFEEIIAAFGRFAADR